MYKYFIQKIVKSDALFNYCILFFLLKYVIIIIATFKFRWSDKYMFKRILKELNGAEKVIFIIHKLIVLMIFIFSFKYVFVDYLNIFSIELTHGILIDLIYVIFIILLFGCLAFSMGFVIYMIYFLISRELFKKTWKNIDQIEKKYKK